MAMQSWTRGRFVIDKVSAKKHIEDEDRCTLGLHFTSPNHEFWMNFLILGEDGKGPDDCGDAERVRILEDRRKLILLAGEHPVYSSEDFIGRVYEIAYEMEYSYTNVRDLTHVD